LKLSKTSWIILTVGIFLITFTCLGLARSQQVLEQGQLDEELSLAEWRLDQIQFEELYSQQEELEEQLSQVVSELEAARAILSQSTGSIVASDTLFDIAEVCGVTITEISSLDPAPKDLEGVTCSLLPLTVRIEGNVPSLIRFTTMLNNDFTTGVVNSVGINVPEVIEDDGETDEESIEEQSSEEEPEVVEKPTAYISLVIYTY